MKISLRTFFSLALCITFCLSGNAQDPVEEYLDREFMLDDLRKLSHDAAEGRETGTRGAEAARRYIANSFKTTGLKKLNKGYLHDFTFDSGDKKITGHNVVGYIKGELSTAIVITAHYDGLGKRDSVIYNGADDNASGVAALLSMADFFKSNKPRHTIVFAALDAEEKGLQGARAFVEDERIPMDAVILNINMDMISNNNKNELHIAGTSHYPNLKPFLEEINTGVIRFKFGHDTADLGNNDWTNSSDHAPFHAKKIPFIYFGVEDHDNYHKPTDTYENINGPFFAKVANLILQAIMRLDEGLN